MVNLVERTIFFDVLDQIILSAALGTCNFSHEDLEIPKLPYQRFVCEELDVFE